MIIKTVFNFEVTPKRKSSPVLTGSFIQYTDFTSIITMSDGLDISKKTDSVISKPLNYLAKIVLERHPDTYKLISNTSDCHVPSVKVKTLAQASSDVVKPNAETITLFKFSNGKLFSAKALSDVIYDVGGGESSIFDIIGKHEKINVPADGKYSNNDFINSVLAYNNADITINRQVVKNLHSGIPILKQYFANNSMKNDNGEFTVLNIVVSVSDSSNNSKSNFSIVNEKTRKYKSHTWLTVNRTMMDLI